MFQKEQRGAILFSFDVSFSKSNRNNEYEYTSREKNFVLNVLKPAQRSIEKLRGQLALINCFHEAHSLDVHFFHQAEGPMQNRPPLIHARMGNSFSSRWIIHKPLSKSKSCARPSPPFWPPSFFFFFFCFLPRENLKRGCRFHRPPRTRRVFLTFALLTTGRVILCYVYSRHANSISSSLFRCQPRSPFVS